jgi:quinolinate synthase
MNKNNDAKLVEEILRFKKEKDAVILTHNYQRGEVQDIADFVGDSLELSQKAEKLSCKRIVFCGVRFMTETAKILSPDKMVLLPRKEAGCPMADMITREELRKIKAEYPEAKVVSYVNTTAEVKAESDVCCTSSNTLKVVKNIDAKKNYICP